MKAEIDIEMIAHRGLWTIPSEKNTRNALRRALEAGFGLETDVRDHGSRLVISHDPPNGSEQTVEDFFAEYRELNCTSTLALNIKADGLADELHRQLKLFQIEKYFCFDMSIPDSRRYSEVGVTLFSRRSEFEPSTSLTEAADGIWLDGFQSEWYQSSEWENWLFRGKSVCIVSPELHKRSRLELWRKLHYWLRASESTKLESRQAQGHFMLCTDFPREFVEER